MQLEALYSLLEDDGSGSLTVHEMIDLFDGVNNDALLIDDCNNAPMPHHWLGDGYCDDGSDVDDGGGDVRLALLVHLLQRVAALRCAALRCAALRRC